MAYGRVWHRSSRGRREEPRRAMFTMALLRVRVRARVRVRVRA